MFSGASAFEAKFKCTDAVTGPASSCVRRYCASISGYNDYWHENTVVGQCLMWDPVIAETLENV